MEAKNRDSGSAEEYSRSQYIAVQNSGQLSSVIVQIQGVRVNFSSDSAPLIAFVRTHFAEREHVAEALGTPPFLNGRNGQSEIEARVEWLEGSPPEAHDTAVPPGKIRLDRDIEIGKGEMVWSRIDDFLDLHLHFFLAENHLRLQGQYFFALSRSPLRNQLKKTWHRKQLPTLRAKRFSTILYYMAYYPAFWWLEHKGLFPLHAAAVELDGRGVVLCGLPGCGKSTLSLALLALPGARLLSDNIIFFDREKVFRCPEPVLVDSRSLRLIGEAASVLQPLGRNHAFGRAWAHVVPGRLVDQTNPRVFLFVGLGHQSSLRPLSYQEAYQRFSSVNWIAQEMRRYLVYRSVLGLVRPDGSHQEHGGEHVVSTLLGQGQCYEFTVGWGDDLRKACDQVSTLLTSGES